MVSQAVDDVGGVVAGFFLDALAFDEEGLSHMGEVQIVVEPRGGPDRARFQTSMIEGERLTEVGFTAGFEQQADIGQQGRLVVFGGEQVVGATLFDDVRVVDLGP